MSAKIHETSATSLGGLAIILWSTAFACNRSLAEQLGPITAAASFQTLAGIIGLLFLFFRKNSFRDFLGFPRSYLIGCGSLFILSQTCAFVSVGLAATRQQAIETSLVYYLWPGLTLVFSIPIFKQKARFLLVPGIVIALLGVTLVTTPAGQLNISGWGENVTGNLGAYLFAGVGAVSWALYSNFSRCFADRIKGSAVPLFLLATGLLLGVLRLGIDESTVFTRRASLEVLFMGLCPMLLAYSLWDIAVRQGNLNLVASASYLTPFFSALVSCIYLGVSSSWTLWIGCILIICGAVLCKVSIRIQPSKVNPGQENSLCKMRYHRKGSEDVGPG